MVFFISGVFGPWFFTLSGYWWTPRQLSAGEMSHLGLPLSPTTQVLQ